MKKRKRLKVPFNFHYISYYGNRSVELSTILYIWLSSRFWDGMAIIEKGNNFFFELAEAICKR